MENRKIRIENAVITVPSKTKMNIAEIADLFGIYYRIAKREIRTIEKQRSTERSVVKSGVAGGDYSLSCTCEGSKIYPDYYGLEMVIAVALHLQSANAVNLIFNIKTTQIYAKITNPKISQDMEVLSQKLESFEKQIIKQI